MGFFQFSCSNLLSRGKRKQSLKAFLFSFFLLFSSLSFADSGFFEPWGKDSDLQHFSLTLPPSETKKSSSLLGHLSDSFITFHQKVISPIDGPRSHFRPTSSRYMQLAIRRYGFFKGFIMGCDRLLRENNESWIYRTIQIGKNTYKYDPAIINKFEK